MMFLRNAQTLLTKPCTTVRFDIAAGDHAGRDAIDGDAAFGVLHGSDFREHDDGGFGRGVVRRSWQAGIARDGAEIDDTSIMALRHARNDLLHAVERAEQIDVDDAFPFILGNGFKKMAATAVVMTPDACVVDENIDFTEGGNYLRKGTLDVF